MKTYLQLLLVALIATLPALSHADSASAAASFAAATPTRYEGSASFQVRNGSTLTNYGYTFVLNRDFKVAALVVNGTPITISVDQPLSSLPYPKVGTVENFGLSLQAWDGDGPGALFAGFGSTFYEALQKGSSVWVWLNPPDLKGFMTVDEIAGTDPNSWSLNVFGGGATSSAVYVDGHWGFWVYLDPKAPSSYYWLVGPGVTEWNVLDPTDIDNSRQPDIGLVPLLAQGVGIADLRNRWPWSVPVTGTIDGNLDVQAYPNGEIAPSHVGEAIAVRCYEQQWVNLFYAGPAAYLIVRELDENGQQTHNPDGSAREWTFAPSRTGDRETEVNGTAPIKTGRAVVLIIPTQDSSRYAAFRLLVDGSANYFGRG